MALFTVDKRKCARDGICVAVCPAAVIEMASPEDYPKPGPDADEFCLGCGHCVAVCPNAALSLNRFGPGECPPVRKGLTLNSEEAGRFLRSRRSIRTFHDRPVEREKLEKLVDMACYAPSAKNMQPWHWVVVENGQEVKRLAGMVIEWMRGILSKNRELGQNLGFVRVVEAWDSGVERICRGAPHVIIVHADKEWPFAAEDCALALDYMELFATSLGLGTCWAGYLYTAINQYPPLFEAVGLPDQHRACGAIMVGYPKFSYHRLPLRNPPRVTWK